MFKDCSDLSKHLRSGVAVIELVVETVEREELGAYAGTIQRGQHVLAVIVRDVSVDRPMNQQHRRFNVPRPVNR